MAVTTLTHKFQKITVPANTNEHTINFDNVLVYNSGKLAARGVAIMELQTGSTVQLSPNLAIDANAGTITEDNNKTILDIKRGEPIRFKGGAGSEEMTISILPD